MLVEATTSKLENRVTNDGFEVYPFKVRKCAACLLRHVNLRSSGL